MLALQDGDRRGAERRADDPEELADALAERLGDPAFAERVTSSWGTFLKPAAGRGYLAFGPERGPQRHLRPPRQPGWGSRSRSPTRPASTRSSSATSHAFPGATKGELARWWGVTAGKLTKPLKRLEDRIESRRPRGQRRPTCSPRTSRRCAAPSPEPAVDDPPPGRLRPVHAVAPEGGGAAAADGPAPARLADRGLDQRGRAVRRRRRGHLDARAEAEGDDDRGQPVAPPDEGGACGDRARRPRRSASSSRPASRSASWSTTRAERPLLGAPCRCRTPGPSPARARRTAARRPRRS